MAARKVELVLTPAGHTCKLLLDGEEVQNCRGVKVYAEVGRATSVMFELINVEVTVSGETDIVQEVPEQLESPSDVTALTDSVRKYAN